MKKIKKKKSKNSDSKTPPTSKQRSFFIRWAYALFPNENNFFLDVLRKQNKWMSKAATALSLWPFVLPTWLVFFLINLKLLSDVSAYQKQITFFTWTKNWRCGHLILDFRMPWCIFLEDRRHYYIFFSLNAKLKQTNQIKIVNRHLNHVHFLK